MVVVVCASASLGRLLVTVTARCLYVAAAGGLVGAGFAGGHAARHLLVAHASSGACAARRSRDAVPIAAAAVAGGGGAAGRAAALAMLALRARTARGVCSFRAV